MSEWQPICKDFYHPDAFLCWSKNIHSDLVGFAQCNDPLDNYPLVYCVSFSPDSPDWESFELEEHDFKEQFTSWMALPQPPEQI